MRMCKWCYKPCGRARYCSVTCQLLAQIEVSGECWIWTGGANDKDYPYVKIGGRMRRAHRVSYTIFVEPIPDGLEIDHVCKTRRCINPAHLEPVTQLVNLQRGDSLNHTHLMAQSRRAKTHCPHGHPYSVENTRITKRGHRLCRECGRRYDRNGPLNR